jgi:DNA-binding SARP family transcriptional activator
MVPTMEFCLLGPLLVRADGVVRPVQPGKQRVVLATLLLDANRIVSVDELAQTLWWSAPPPSAKVTIQNYVKRLRHALGEVGGARISTQPHGYRISVASDELDLLRFEGLLAAARCCIRNASWVDAIGKASAALALWRDQALADVESDLLARRDVPRLAELRLQAAEVRIEAELHVGRQAEAIGELRQLIAASPFWERLYALLMLALYYDGRPADALAVYQQARRVLADELGTAPGIELRRLHQQILSVNPALSAPAAPWLVEVGSAGSPGYGTRPSVAAD